MKSPMPFFLMKIFALVILLVLGWEFCWWGLGVRPLMPWRLKGSLKKSPEDFTLIDVRTALEYELFHIHGSKNQPELLLHPELFKAQDPRKPLVIICMTGHRSSVVAYSLKRRGFTKVHNLTFGMLGWLLAGGRPAKKKSNQRGDVAKLRQNHALVDHRDPDIGYSKFLSDFGKELLKKIPEIED